MMMRAVVPKQTKVQDVTSDNVETVSPKSVLQKGLMTARIIPIAPLTAMKRSRTQAVKMYMGLYDDIYGYGGYGGYYGGMRRYGWGGGGYYGYPGGYGGYGGYPYMGSGRYRYNCHPYGYGGYGSYYGGMGGYYGGY